MTKNQLRSLIRETIKEETQSPSYMQGVDAFNRIYRELPSDIKNNPDVLETIAEMFYEASRSLTDY